MSHLRIAEMVLQAKSDEIARRFEWSGEKSTHTTLCSASFQTILAVELKRPLTAASLQGLSVTTVWGSGKALLQVDLGTVRSGMSSVTISGRNAVCCPGGHVLGDPFSGDNLEAVGGLLGPCQLLCLAVLAGVNSPGQELTGGVPALSGLVKPHVRIPQGTGVFPCPRSGIRAATSFRPQGKLRGINRAHRTALRFS